MATYKSRYSKPQRRKKQKYTLLERILNFNRIPDVGYAWKAGDVIQAIQLKSGQTVIGIQVEIIKVSGTSNAVVKVGYGTDVDFWGVYDFSTAVTQTTGFKSEGQGMKHNALVRNFGVPLYFSSNDTIDIVINKAITDGKLRLIVHILEDDR